MYETKKYKMELRKTYLEKRASLSPETRQNFDESIRKKIMGTAVYHYADTVLLFYPMKGEIDILPLMEDALSKGKKVAFPRCEKGEHTMAFAYVQSKDDFEVGSYGIMEPKKEMKLMNPDTVERENVLCIVPALVYDEKGYRVGYGGGYYDRFFDSIHPSSIGIIYEDFIVKTVPHGRYDIAVDVIISERGIYAGKT